MLQQETLKENDDGLYEKPEGEFLELIEQHRNSVSVLTRVNIEKAAGPPIAPGDYNVSELETVLDDMVIEEEQRDALLEAEKENKNRTTAIGVIKRA